MARAPREQGFTLIEIIVVIVLFSLITTLSIQGIGYVLGQRARMAQFQQEMVTTTLHHQWFMGAVTGLAVPPEDSDYQFSGNAREFQGFSLSPLVNPDRPGVYISWRISTERGLQSLTYYQFDSTTSSAAPAASIPIVNGMVGEAYFKYLDETGHLHAEWPPDKRAVSQVKFNTLPEAIFLYMGSAGEVSWLARLGNAKNVKETERFTE